MSEETIELTLAGYDAWNRGDLDGLLETMDEAIEYHTSGVFPGLDPVYRATRGFASSGTISAAPGSRSQSLSTTFASAAIGVVALYNFNAVERDGLSVHREAANVLTVRDGLAVRIDAHGSWRSALESVGLDEQRRVR